MNAHRTRPADSAFTLIELLTVIAIIAVLMGLLFPAIGAVKEQARKTQAKNDLTQIVTAVNAYYTEYSKYPVWPQATTAADVKYDDTNSASLFNVLRSINPSSDPTLSLNPRQVVFLSAPIAKTDTTGANPKGGVDTTTGKYYDPWGVSYNVAVDADYDNVIKTATHGYTDSNYASISAGVIAWSFGKDKKQGVNGNKKFAGSDDVISWQ